MIRKGNIMKLIIIFGLLLTLSAAPVLAETISRVAAIVNDDIITTFQLDKAVAAERKANNLAELSEESLKRLQSQILERMIDEKLLAQRVSELGLDVSEKELESAIDDVQKQNNLTREQLIMALKDQGMDFATYRANLKQEIMRYKLIGREVNSRVEVTNKEVRQYFREHIDEYRVEPSVHLKRISFNIPADATTEQQAAVHELAEVIRNKLTVGEEPFDAVLASLGNTADGADMGSLEESALLPLVQDAIRGLDTGQVSEPTEAAGSLHLFLIADRNPGDSQLFDKVKGEIQEILRKKNTDERFVEWSQELRKQAHIKILF